MILICGFSPDFFKRKTLTHHYPLCVVCLFYHCPSPGGVPLFANVETRFTGLGGSGEGSVLRHSTPVPFWVQILSQAPGQTDVLGGRTEVGNPPCLVVFRVFQFCFGFLFHFFFSISFISWHNEACLSQCYAMDFYENSLSVSHTIFFNAVYSPVNSLCKI